MERLTQLQMLEYGKTNRTGPDTAFTLDGRPSSEPAKAHIAATAQKLHEEKTATRAKQPTQPNKNKDRNLER